MYRSQTDRWSSKSSLSLLPTVPITSQVKDLLEKGNRCVYIFTEMQCKEVCWEWQRLYLFFMLNVEKRFKENLCLCWNISVVISCETIQLLWGRTLTVCWDMKTWSLREQTKWTYSYNIILIIFSWKKDKCLFVKRVWRCWKMKKHTSVSCWFRKTTSFNKILSQTQNITIFSSFPWNFIITSLFNISN